MASDIRIGVAADTREFAGSVRKDVAGALDDVADALDDLAKGSDQAGEKLEDSLKGAQQGAEQTEKSFKDLSRTLSKESKDAGRDIGRNIDDGLDKAEDGLGEFKDEAKSTAREGAASFSGEWDDVGDIVQETLANALGGFGPIGAAAGLALAAGFGTLYAKIQGDAEASEERVASMYDAMIESQGKYLTESSIMDQVKTFTDDTAAMADAQKVAASTGLDLGIVLRAMAGDTDAAAEVQAALNEQYEISVNNANKAAEESRDLTSAEREQAQAVGLAGDAMGKYADDMQKASDKYDAYASAARYANNQMQDAAKTAAGLRTEIVKLPNGKTINVTLGVKSDQFQANVSRALNNARALASKGIDVPFQITKNGTKVY